MEEETKKNIKEVQQNNNYPGLEKLIRLVRAKYKGAISRNDVKQFLAKDLPTQLYATQQKIRSKGHIVAFVKDEMWQMDIFVMRSGLALYNEHYIYIYIYIYMHRCFHQKGFHQNNERKEHRQLHCSI